MTSRPLLCFSSRPRIAAKPDRPQDQLHWLMTPSCGADQSVETMTLKGHTWTAGEYSIEILPWDGPQNPHPQKPLGWRTQHSSLYGAHPWFSPLPAPRHIFLASVFLFPKLQGPFSCLCHLFPEPISSMAHFCYLCNFLNKLSLIVWVLALNSFIVRTQVLRLQNPRSSLIPLV